MTDCPKHARIARSGRPRIGRNSCLGLSNAQRQGCTTLLERCPRETHAQAVLASARLHPSIGTTYRGSRIMYQLPRHTNRDRVLLRVCHFSELCPIGRLGVPSRFRRAGVGRSPSATPINSRKRVQYRFASWNCPKRAWSFPVIKPR